MTSRQKSHDDPPAGTGRRPDDPDAAPGRVQSMTGYAHRTEDTPLGRVTIELRSVNNRFTDLSFRLGDDLRLLEPRLRERITAAVQRGKIECRLQLRSRDAEPGRIRLDEALMANLAEIDTRIRAFAPDAAPMTVADYLRWNGSSGHGAADAADPPVVAPADTPAGATAGAEAEAGEDLLWRLLEPLVDQTLAEFVESRTREGERLAQTIAQQIADMGDVVAAVGPLVPQLLAQAQGRLTTRLQEAMADVQSPIPAEETFARIRQEIALLTLRGDVTEELDRLRIHFDEVLAALRRGGAVGKRLDFLTQELNREANTIASKASGIAVTNGAVALKLLIEQLREQVQNME